ncbi:MAG: M3 family oligoendopeptidase [Treponema sp.]|jgi:pepF/M3 family oligoendopeptidase|nr:M3 family oligoendopeptidase [Treponema sp.]
MPNGTEAGLDGALPQWRLDSIYPPAQSGGGAFDSPAYQADLRLLGEEAGTFLAALAAPLPDTPAELAPSLLALIRLWEQAGDRAENLRAYTEAIYSVDTRSAQALRELNRVERLALPLGKGTVLLRKRMAEQQDLILGLLESGGVLRPYGFFIQECLAKARFQMETGLEDLANDLARSGADAWERLHGAISSTVWGLYEAVPGRLERKTVTALRDLAHDPDRSVRERAYHAELAAWQTAALPLAAALNGVKGTAITLDTRRGWASALEKSAFQSRITMPALHTLIAVLEGALPLFRRYLKIKARVLGLAQCGFYDLFAPVGGSGRTWTWEAAAAFIIQRFDAFDPDMGAFARRAAAHSWIDAQGREGKIGGAYCTAFPLAGESRLLCNFEGSFDSLTTAAHELGHGWHHELIKDLPRSRSQYPMTLAETASIFAETLVFESALSEAAGSNERGLRLALIEGNLKDACQLVVDILSRFYFERGLFERREQGELSPEELCALMTSAQEKTYGDGLDPKLLHPYMWAVKSHYYSPGLAFYNYPYAFGLLFAQGLYARYCREGPGFAAPYRELLRTAGQAPAEEAARSAGFSLEEAGFWEEGLTVIARRIAEFEALAGEGGIYPCRA